MKTTIIGLISAALLGLLSANAQEVLQLRFNAKCQGTNETGKLLKQKVTNDTILQDYANQNGITNLSSIALVYAVDGDERGDLIEIVDAYTGAVLTQLYGFFFPMDLPTSSDGSKFSRFAYMFNSQQSYEMGSALLDERIKFDRNGNTNRMITGNIQFYLTPDATNGLRLCSGTITAGKTFVLTTNTNTPPSTNVITGRTVSH